ncbi:hypothetical protein BD779DRAFT_1545345 [Infundibulicybe gibba]|nr:hypothetical protein BD779DRAFT_1545345 [Infundibulicybe gibba]
MPGLSNVLMGTHASAVYATGLDPGRTSLTFLSATSLVLHSESLVPSPSRLAMHAPSPSYATKPWSTVQLLEECASVNSPTNPLQPPFTPAASLHPDYTSRNLNRAPMLHLPQPSCAAAGNTFSTFKRGIVQIEGSNNFLSNDSAFNSFNKFKNSCKLLHSP